MNISPHHFNIRYIISLLLIVFLMTQCQEKKMTFQAFTVTPYFHQVQTSGIFEDSKSFVDAVPQKPYGEIVKLYRREQRQAGFDLKAFTLRYFQLPEDPPYPEPDANLSMEAYIDALWPVLERKGAAQAEGTAIPLPYDYVVPGGRFREIYYWDSYFTMLGLISSGEVRLARQMVANFTHLIDSLGYIPNGSRTYYLSRSQPPFYALMVELLADYDTDILVSVLPQLQREYDFWMEGSEYLSDSLTAYRRVVRIHENMLLNRYWDEQAVPRPESYTEDIHTASQNTRSDSIDFRNLRAGAESGWDYSSRWMDNNHMLSSIQTLNILPVDLNALIFHLEMLLSSAYVQAGDLQRAMEMEQRAKMREKAIHAIFWNEDDGIFTDYDWVADVQVNKPTLAGMYPLFFKIATAEEVEHTARTIDSLFLAPGGFVTTLEETGQQWDYPNGWAPLQWITFSGLLNYGQDSLAFEGARRWLALNRKVYRNTGRMMEKYNVIDTTLIAGGGEYPTQDGFGWTNGVAIMLSKLLSDK